MSNVRFFSAIALTAILTGTFVAGLTLSRPARADTPRTSTCASMGGNSSTAMTKFMDAELARGRTQFLLTDRGYLCAW